jgi:hypothetical protein
MSAKWCTIDSDPAAVVSSGAGLLSLAQPFNNAASAIAKIGAFLANAMFHLTLIYLCNQSVA